jgi:organic radical activating enzyme
MSFCVLPWLHLATHPHGGVSLCCRVDYTDGIGMSFNQIQENRNFLNLNSNKISETINSDSFKKARIEMLGGRWPQACLGCKKEESSGLKSKRQRENEYFDFDLKKAALLTDASGEIKPSFEYLELRLGNLCNLKCRTCNPYSSSKWTQDYQVLESKLDFVRKYDQNAQFNWAEDENFWNEAYQSSKSLKLLFINGGEPTLIKQHWAYLEKLIAAGLAKNIEIKYNINMTYLPTKAQEIWKSFKSVFIGASVDDLRERNSYIRHGASWNLIEENLLKIKSWSIPIAIEQTVSAMNVFYVDEMEAYTKQIGIGYGLNFVYDPDFLAAEVLPSKTKQIVLEKLKSSNYSERWYQHIEAALKNQPDANLWAQFLKYTEELDQMRSENFKKTFSQFAELYAE